MAKTRSTLLVVVPVLVTFVIAPLAAAESIEAFCLVFSGEVQPSVVIWDPQTISLLRFDLSNLPATLPDAWPDLGWRGIMLVNNDVPDFPLMVHVFAGQVRLYEPDGIKHFADVNDVETSLLLDQQVCDSIGQTVLLNVSPLGLILLASLLLVVGGYALLQRRVGV